MSVQNVYINLQLASCNMIFRINILDVIKYCDHPRWYEKIPAGCAREFRAQMSSSDRRSHLQLEISLPIRGLTSDCRSHWCMYTFQLRCGTRREVHSTPLIKKSPLTKNRL